MKRALWILCFAVIATSCTRQSLPDPVVIPSQFSARGTIDGMDTEIAAGENNFYLEPSYARTEFGVLEYISTFKKDNGDPTELEVVILDDSWELPVHIGNISPDAALIAGMIPFQLEEAILDSLALNFCSFEGVVNKQYTWLINGMSYDEPTPIHHFEEGEENLDARLWITDTETGCVDSLIQVCEDFDPNHNYSDFFYRPFLTATTSITNQLRLTYDGDDSETTELRWDIVDGTESIEAFGTSVIHEFGDEGPHLVTLSVTLDNGHEFVYAERVRSDGDESACSADIHYISPPLGAPETSTVRVNYTDASGLMYSSLVAGIAPAGGVFEIISVDEISYEDESDNLLEARMLEVVFSCTLYNIDDPSQSILIEDFTGTFAVAIPQ